MLANAYITCPLRGSHLNVFINEILLQACQTQCILRAAWKNMSSWGRYKDGENYHRLLLISCLSIRFTFRSSIFTSTRKCELYWNKFPLNLIELHLKLNLLKLGHFGPHIVYNLRTESGPHTTSKRTARGPRAASSTCLFYSNYLTTYIKNLFFLLPFFRIVFPTTNLNTSITSVIIRTVSKTSKPSSKPLQPNGSETVNINVDNSMLFAAKMC